jgi:hypothetical protein
MLLQSHYSELHIASMGKGVKIKMEKYKGENEADYFVLKNRRGNCVSEHGYDMSCLFISSRKLYPVMFRICSRSRTHEVTNSCHDAQQDFSLYSLLLTYVPYMLCCTAVPILKVAILYTCYFHSLYLVM